MGNRDLRRIEEEADNHCLMWKGKEGYGSVLVFGLTYVLHRLAGIDPTSLLVDDAVAVFVCSMPVSKTPAYYRLVQ